MIWSSNCLTCTRFSCRFLKNWTNCFNFYLNINYSVEIWQWDNYNNYDNWNLPRLQMSNFFLESFINAQKQDSNNKYRIEFVVTCWYCICKVNTKFFSKNFHTQHPSFICDVQILFAIGKQNHSNMLAKWQQIQLK